MGSVFKVYYNIFIFIKMHLLVYILLNRMHMQVLKYIWTTTSKYSGLMRIQFNDGSHHGNRGCEHTL